MHEKHWYQLTRYTPINIICNCTAVAVLISSVYLINDGSHEIIMTKKCDS